MSCWAAATARSRPGPSWPWERESMPSRRPISTAMVYPTLIAAVSDASHPSWRARALSVYRFWRDLGYAIGALCAGVIADIFGMQWAIATVAAITFASGVVVALAMNPTRRPRG